MPPRFSRLAVSAAAAAAVTLAAHAETASPAAVDYNFHVRPILAEHCFKCHGADEKQRKGKLRLDERDAAVAKKAIVPGKPDESELVMRILTADPEDVMPPPKENHALTSDQKEILKVWIAQGAEYKKHWAFIPVVKPPVPELESPRFKVRNPIDAFVLAKLNERRISPAAPATKEQWMRRATFAITGLPPAPEELDAFAADDSPLAFEHVVERLLKSSAYAEHMARDWLDAARYADSYGRHEDGDMVAWPWRDWVIRAFHDNLPFDQFITWQCAGDLLPNPTRDQLVATAFNRLAPQSNESGNDPEEFRLDQVGDRVRVNGLAFMGLTIECAKCHDHKYDPISQHDYWAMAAFFDNIDENGVYSQFCPQAVPSPSLLLTTKGQDAALAETRRKIAAQEAVVRQAAEAARPRFEKWLASRNLPGTPKAGFWNSVKGWFGEARKEPYRDHADAHIEFDDKLLEKQEDKQNKKELVNLAFKKRPAKLRAALDVIKEGPRGKAMLFKGDDELHIDNFGDFHQYDSFSFAIWLQPRESRERAVVVARSRGGIDDGRGYEVLLQHEVPEFALMHFHPGNEIRIRARQPIPLNKWTHLAVTYDGSSRASGLKLYLDGVPALCDVVEDQLHRDIFRRKEWGDIDLDQVRFTVGGREHDGSLKNCGVDEFWVFPRAISPGEVKLLAKKPSEKSDWFAWWVEKYDENWKEENRRLRSLRKQETKLTGTAMEMMVMQELPSPRPCFVHPRGDPHQRGEKVEPDVPGNILQFPQDAPRNRLGYARWLVSRSNPLTSRVAVNRIWQMFFGRGLVATPQDFGTRGDLPSHPELLDWLAADFTEHGWDVQRLCRMIALSSTFAQSSAGADDDSLKADPDNRFLSRGPRTRLSAEEVRDQALAAAGLLCARVGGPSAHPYLPAELYRQSGLQQHYVEDTGDNLYRRSMYTFWRRTLPPPDLAVFDAPSREFCVVKREKTNTPLQALALLNDVQFVEAQRMLAERTVRREPVDDSRRCVLAFRLLTSREPSPREADLLGQMLRRERAYFAGHPQEADALLAVGSHPADHSLPAVEIAATTIVARALMSHAESVSR
jgi:hypothetical protein